MVQLPLLVVPSTLNVRVFVVGCRTIQSCTEPVRYREADTFVPAPVFIVSASVSITMLVPEEIVPVYPITDWEDAYVEFVNRGFTNV
jgi:hypothetical protein